MSAYPSNAMSDLSPSCRLPASPDTLGRSPDAACEEARTSSSSRDPSLSSLLPPAIPLKPPGLTMDSRDLPAFLQTHLFNCRFHSDPAHHSYSTRFRLRNGRQSLQLTSDEEKHVGFILNLLEETDAIQDDPGLRAIQKIIDSRLAKALEEAKRVGAAAVSDPVRSTAAATRLTHSLPCSSI